MRQGYEVWLPQMSTWKKTGGVWQRKDVPLFPRYLFARPVNAAQSIAPIRSTLGVSSLVCFGREPACLRAETLEQILQVVAARAKHLDGSISPFVAGETVSIASGPLAGLTGIVTRPALERVTVLLSLLGREKEVLLDQEMLIKVA